MSDLFSVGRFLILLGIIIALFGVVIVLASRLPAFDRLGRLPGDIVLERGSFTLFLPLMSSILVSVVLTLVLNVFLRR